MNYFLYRLIGPRPTFGPDDMSEDEAEIMGRHAGYWGQLLADRTAVAYGPVLDPAGNWGLGVVEVESEVDVEELRAADPAVASGMCRAEILPMAAGFSRS